jgi:hypothetical protein
LKKDAFILFLKYPERGAAKTRLVSVLGDDLTYELPVLSRGYLGNDAPGKGSNVKIIINY